MVELLNYGEVESSLRKNDTLALIKQLHNNYIVCEVIEKFSDNIIEYNVGDKVVLTSHDNRNLYICKYEEFKEASIDKLPKIYEYMRKLDTERVDIKRKTVVNNEYSKSADAFISNINKANWCKENELKYINMTPVGKMRTKYSLMLAFSIVAIALSLYVLTIGFLDAAAIMFMASLIMFVKSVPLTLASWLKYESKSSLRSKAEAEYIARMIDIDTSRHKILR